MNRRKQIISIVIGVGLPWLYFLFTDFAPIRIIDANGVQTTGESGALGFIQFFGLGYSVALYGVVSFILYLAVYVLMSVYNTLGNNHEK